MSSVSRDRDEGSRLGRMASAGLVFAGAAMATLAASALNAQSSEPLSIDEALRISLSDQPGLDAFDRTVQSFEEAAVAAEQLPDFRLFGGVRNFPVTGGDAFSFNAERSTARFIGIGRRQTPGDRRRADAARLLAEASVVEAERALTERRIEREVLNAWINVVEARERQAVLQNLIDERQGRYATAEARVPTGAANAADAIAARADIAAIRADLSDAHGDEAAARAMLSRWIGEAAERPLTDNLPICRVTVPARARASIEDHPQLVLARQQTTVAERTIDVARADRQPEWGWSVVYGNRSGLSDLVGIELSIDLPLNRARLQDRRVAEASELAAASRERLEDSRRELLAQLDEALARFAAAEARLATTAGETYPALRAAEQAQEARFEVGGGSLESVLIASDRTTRTVLELVEQRAAVARASADLYYYTEECDI